MKIIDLYTKKEQCLKELRIELEAERKVRKMLAAVLAEKASSSGIDVVSTLTDSLLTTQKTMIKLINNQLLTNKPTMYITYENTNK